MSASNRSHLHPSIRDLLDLDDRARIRELKRDRWISYPAAKAVLDMMEECWDHPPSQRMPNLLVIGDTSSGKTAVVRYFRQQYAPTDDARREEAVVPVLYCLCPPTPHPTWLYHAILEAIFAPYHEKAPAAALHYQVIRTLGQLGTRMLIVDEIHNIFQGSTDRQKLFLNLLKNLANELQIVLVAVGTQEAQNAIATDRQLENRFEVMSLPRWKLSHEWRRLLASYETLLPLRVPSSLGEDELAKKLHDMSNGYLGELVRILRRAGAKAIKDKSERITVDLLKKLPWTPPDNRRGFQPGDDS